MTARPVDQARAEGAPPRGGGRVLRGRLSPAEMYPAHEPTLGSRFVTVASGFRVRVLECGARDGPPVLLLHGWCCSAFTYRRNVSGLVERGCRVVAPDLKGHGLSDKPLDPAEYTLASMADHVVEIMDAVGLERATIVGHSMGAAIAVAVALRHPARAGRLALLAPVGFGAISVLGIAQALTPRILTPLLPRLISRWMIAAVLRLAYGGWGGFSRRDVEEYFAPTQFPEFVRAMRELLHRFRWAPGRREELQQLRVPTLVIFGTRDRLVYTPSVEALVRSIPDVTYEVLPGAGHVLPEESSETVNERLTAFAAGDEVAVDRVARGVATG